MFKFGRNRPYEDGINLTPSRFLRWQFWLLTVTASLALMVSAFGIVYWQQIGPRDSASDANVQLVEVVDGDSVGSIASKLKDQSLIRSDWAFKAYARLHHAVFLPGRYQVSSHQSIADIIDVMAKGKSSILDVTITAGLTLDQIKQKLISGYGYSAADVDKALTAGYNSPLLADKPTNASLEGYIYPETFRVDVDDDLTELFKRDFNELYSKMTSDNLIVKFKHHGLNIYQALTLASIVQMEASKPNDQRIVAQVFYKRLKEGKPLAADPTAIYGAKEAGINLPSGSSDAAAKAAAIAISYDTVYNTRKHKGLPPGPIANMEYSALQAVANPAKTKYLYFVGGDNGKIYYAKTFARHEANITKHCHEKCQ